MYFSNDKFTFVHIPKTGGTSMKAWLSSQLEIKDWSINGEIVNYSGDTHKRLIKKPDNYSFTIVRNPYDWVLSYYNFMLNRSDFYKAIGKNGEGDHTKLDFIDWLDETPPKPQCHYFCSDEKNSCFLVDEVFRFEEMDKAIESLSKRFNINDGEFPHLKDLKKYNLYTKKTLTRDEKSVIKYTYYQDFKLLGY